jgi:amino acid transporter
MSRMHAATKPSAVSRALARDRLGVPAVLFFVLAGVAPLTVAAGVIPTAYATTGLTGIPATFVLVALILAVWTTGYVAMTRHITNAGAFYAFIARGLGRPLGVALPWWRSSRTRSCRSACTARSDQQPRPRPRRT